MSRTPWFALLLVLLLGCTLPPEQVPLKPLPEGGPPQPYVDIVGRARVQATAANEAFYINNWSDLEEAARGLEQTALFLAKSSEVPGNHKDTLVSETSDLGKEATQLREAAKNHDTKHATEALQRINLQVRALRPSDR
jgi:hypothetical protein